MGNEKAYADLQAAVAEQVAALTEQRGLGFASDKESWADLRKRVEECDDLLKNIKNVQKDMWKAIRENDPDRLRRTGRRAGTGEHDHDYQLAGYRGG